MLGVTVSAEQHGRITGHKTGEGYDSVGSPPHSTMIAKTDGAASQPIVVVMDDDEWLESLVRIRVHGVTPYQP